MTQALGLWLREGSHVGFTTENDKFNKVSSAWAVTLAEDAARAQGLTADD